MIHTEVQNEVECFIDCKLLEQAAEKTLQHQAVGPADLTLVLTDDEELQRLNLQYLGIDAPTDVLSFPEDFTDPDLQARYLGDILISIERAQQQADAAGHSLLDELLLLTVHGVLHLLGHDHAEEDEKQRMWTAQDEILRSLKPRDSSIG